MPSVPLPTAMPTSSPAVIPQLHYLPENHLGTRLFSLDSETGNYLAWQTWYGETKIFDGNTAKTLLPSTKYDIVNPMLGYVNAAQQGLLLVREETQLDHPSDPNPGSSHAITLQGGQVLHEDYLAQMQIRALGITPDGKGYALLSDEYRIRLADKQDIADYPNVSLYIAKVADFKVGEPELLLETGFKNVRAEQIISHAHIKPDGSGFFLLPDSTSSGLVLQKFNAMRETFTPQIVPAQSNEDYFLPSPITDNTHHFLSRVEVKYQDRYTRQKTLVIYPIVDDQLTGQSYRVPAPVISASMLREDYTFLPYTFHLDKEGTGLLVTLQRDEESMSDVVILQAFKNFVPQASQHFVYPNHGAVVDLKLMLDEKGTGKIVMIEGQCSADKRCGKFTPQYERMQLSYLKVRDFILD